MRVGPRVAHTTDRTDGSHVLLAVCSIAAGVIHVAVVPQHLEEDRVFGVFFILTAGLQIAWAMRVLFAPSAIIYSAGALANGALIGAWVVLRTMGLPIGPHLWMPEPARALDVTASLLELLLVVGSLVLVRRWIHVDGYDASGDRLEREDQVCV